MFTGLVQTLSTVRAIRDEAGGRRLTVHEPALAAQLAEGESIAVNGVCLTVVARTEESFDFEAGPETLTRTTLGSLAIGDRVNLERSLRVGDHLGGHFVTGHVDGIGAITEQVQTGEWFTIWVRFPSEFEELLVAKGSIAVDGVSMTIVDVSGDRFSVMLIPHTREKTTLGLKQVGSPVNLEFDLLAKHVQKLFKRLSINV